MGYLSTYYSTKTGASASAGFVVVLILVFINEVLKFPTTVINHNHVIYSFIISIQNIYKIYTNTHEKQ